MSVDQILRREDIDAALLRSAAKARQIAAQTRTPLVVVRKGRMVEIDVETEVEEAKKG